MELNEGTCVKATVCCYSHFVQCPDFFAPPTVLECNTAVVNTESQVSVQ